MNGRNEGFRPRRFHPYPEYRDSDIEWLGAIPAHWHALALKRVCRLSYGESLAADDRVDGGAVVFGSNGPVGTHNRTNTQAPCLIVGRKGSFGKVNYSADAVFAIDTTFVIDKRYTDADLRWLFYTLQNAHLDRVSKDSAIPGLDREDVYAFVTAVGSIDEQRAIAAFLDRETSKIDALVAKKERLIGLLQEKRTALITRAVTQGLDPNVPMKDSGVEWLGEIPAHWELKPVGRIADSLVGFPFPSGRFSTEAGVRLVRGDNVTTGSLRWGRRTRYWPESPPHDDRYFLSKRDVVIGMDGSKVGRNYALIGGSELPLLLVQRVTRLRMTGDHDAGFVFLSIADPRFHAHVDTNRTDPAVPHITLKDILNFPLPVPPAAEQRAIAAFLDRKKTQLDALVAKTRKAINHLGGYRTALISAAVTGKIDVRKEAA